MRGNRFMTGGKLGEKKQKIQGKETEETEKNKLEQDQFQESFVRGMCLPIQQLLSVGNILGWRMARRIKSKISCGMEIILSQPGGDSD